MRDPDSFILEVHYWRAILGELRDLHEDVGAAADELASVILHSVPLAAGLRDDGARAELSAIVVHSSACMTALRAVQVHATALGALVDGRLAALAAEAPATTGGAE